MEEEEEKKAGQTFSLQDKKDKFLNCQYFEMDTCECGNEPLGSIKYMEFLN